MLRYQSAKNPNTIRRTACIFCCSSPMKLTESDWHECSLGSFYCSIHCGRQLHRRRCMWQKVGAQKLESLSLKSGPLEHSSLRVVYAYKPYRVRIWPNFALHSPTYYREDQVRIEQCWNWTNEHGAMTLAADNKKNISSGFAWRFSASLNIGEWKRKEVSNGHVVTVCVLVLHVYIRCWRRSDLNSWNLAMLGLSNVYVLKRANDYVKRSPWLSYEQTEVPQYWFTLHQLTVFVCLCIHFNPNFSPFAPLSLLPFIPFSRFRYCYPPIPSPSIFLTNLFPFPFALLLAFWFLHHANRSYRESINFEDFLFCHIYDFLRKDVPYRGFIDIPSHLGAKSLNPFPCLCVYCCCMFLLLSTHWGANTVYFWIWHIWNNFLCIFWNNL